MITRGILIGQIIDNLGKLKSQVEFRCNLGLTDLNKYSEDFFSELMNIIYDYNLKNLNDSRSNEPGLDLGDEKKSIAYQVTSVATSAKINDTLEKITDDQSTKFKSIKVLIIGQKQGSYTGVKEELKTKFSFSETKDIIDLQDLSKDLISIPYDKLYDAHSLFEREFQIVITELEVPNKDGIYPTTISDKVEIVPTTRPLNANLFLVDDDENTLEAVNTCFDKLSVLPRITREFLKILIDLGEIDDENYHIPYIELTRKLNIPETQIKEEISILINRGLLFEPDETDPEIRTRFSLEMFCLIEYAKRQNILTSIIVSMDFTKLDSEN